MYSNLGQRFLQTEQHRQPEVMPTLFPGSLSYPSRFQGSLSPSAGTRRRKPLGTRLRSWAGVEQFIFLAIQFDLDYCLSISTISIPLCKCFLILNLRIETGTGGFTVTWFVTIVWEPDKERIAHGLPYLEILKGWLKDSIFTRQHKMAHTLLSSLLVNQKHQKHTFF